MAIQPEPGSGDAATTLRAYAASTASLALSAVATQGIGFVATLINARLYGPSEVGLLALFVTAWGLAGLLATLRYELAIVTADEDESAADVSLLIVAMGGVIGLLAAACLVLLEPLLLPNSAFADFRRIVEFMPIALPLMCFSLAGTNICVRRRNFMRVAGQQIAVVVVASIAQVALAGTAVPGGGLIAGFILGQAAGVLVIARPLLRTVMTAARPPGVWPRLSGAAMRYRDFPLYASPYSLVTQIYFQAPMILLGLFHSSHQVGMFSLAFRTTTTPFGLLPNAIGQVIFPDIARDRHSMSRWEDRLRSVLICLGVIQAPAAALVIAFGGDLYSALLGPDWWQCGEVARVLMLPNLMMMLAGGYDRIYFALGRQRAAFFMMFAASTVSIMAMWTAPAFGYALASAWSAVHIVFAFAWMAGAYWISGFSLFQLSGSWLSICVVIGGLVSVLVVATALGWPLGVLIAAVGLALYAWAAGAVIKPVWALWTSRLPGSQ